MPAEPHVTAVYQVRRRARIKNERRIVARTVVGSKPWTAIIAPAVGQGRRVEGVYRLATRCNQRQMKARPRSELHAGLGLQEQRNLSPGYWV